MKYLFSILFCCILSNSFAVNSFWQKTTNRNLAIEGERKIIPQKSNILLLDEEAFKLFQKTIPKEGSLQSALISLPTPDGNEMIFKIFENPCMEAPLAAKYPMIKTYKAVSVENPAVTAKIDYTTFGFHAMVFGSNGIYFIDPYSSSNTGYYNCYYKKDYTRTSNNYTHCELDETMHASDAYLQRNGTTVINDDINNLVANGARRTYRLALACTVEYSNAVCAPNPVTKANVLSAMVTSMNRVNGVYEKDLSIHMNLVANNDTLIFIGTDSYSNNNGSQMLGQNQTVCNARIGSANYDIGHVFSTGGGGVAYLGCVCVNADKARGVTGSSSPKGDAYDIDYVAHEMGHQFGANHTFNGNTGACNGNRNASTAYEPGSGITIMGYAGICDANDIQEHSDDFFHRTSIVEIYNHISSTSCAVVTNTGHTAPTVSTYTATYSIPYKTSFEVSANATSANGFPINYLWEEWDLGPAGSWSNPNIYTAPIFRSFVPSPSNTRIFPRWDSLINNVIRYKGEVLPEVARDVKLRCTVTSYDPNGYGVFNAPDNNLTIKSVVTPTLFRVTSQAAATTFTGNTTQTINWDVANTTASPISCATVNIYLSIDSARTFPYLLATNTANDGTETVTIPNVFTNNASARIKVKGSGNVFFDLNDGWIKINQGIAASFTTDRSSICVGESIAFTNTSLGNPDSVRWEILGGLPNTSNSTTTINSTFANAGTFEIKLYAYKNGILANSFSTFITVKPKPTIQFTPATAITCTGVPIDISANYLSGATCVWSTGSNNQTINVSPTENTYYSVTVTNDGCSAVDSILVNVNPTKTINLAQIICANDSVVIGGTSFNTSGNHTVTLQTSLGCDSIINLALTVNPTKTTNLTRSICDGESVTIGNTTYNTSGSHTVTLQTSLGCDSIVHLALTVNSIPATPTLSYRNDTLSSNIIMAGATYLWYKENVLIATTSTSYLEITENGIYTLKIENNDCVSSLSNVVNAEIITAVRINKQDIQFAIIPNPNNGVFDLKLTTTKSGKFLLSIYNITGQQLLKEEINIAKGVNVKQINLKNIEKGMYFIAVANEDGINTQNILIQ